MSDWHSLLPPANTRYGLLCMSLSIAFFKSLDQALQGYSPPPEVARKGPDSVWKWRNMMVSWVHALLVGTWDILCFYYYPSLMNDLVEHVVPFTYYMVAISTGYFLFDFWDMYKQRKVFKLLELSLHHFAVLSAFIYNLLTVRFIGYTVVALLAEVNSIFLHTRKLMQMHRVSFTNPMYRLNAVLNLITFAGCRGYCLFRITYGMYMEPHRMSPFYLVLLCFSMGIMNILNPILFWILFRNDFLRPPPPPAERHADKTSSNGKPALVNSCPPLCFGPLSSKINDNELILS